MSDRLDSVMRARRMTNAALAGAVRRDTSTITRLRRGEKRASPELAIAIEVALDSEVKRGDLRPDLWPEVRTPQVAA